MSNKLKSIDLIDSVQEIDDTTSEKFRGGAFNARAANGLLLEETAGRNATLNLTGRNVTTLRIRNNEPVTDPVGNGFLVTFNGAQENIIEIRDFAHAVAQNIPNGTQTIDIIQNGVDRPRAGVVQNFTADESPYARLQGGKLIDAIIRSAS